MAADGGSTKGFDDSPGGKDHVETVKDGRLQRTSPSAIETFKRCPTAWWLRYVEHAVEHIHPKVVKAQRIGTQAHKELEDYLTGVRTREQVTDVLAKALLKFAPMPGKDLLVEGRTAPLLTCAGISVAGRIDFAHNRLPTRPMVADWKTRSDLGKYQKTEEELKDDVQMVCYSKWAWLKWPEATIVDIAHYYVQTKEHKNFRGDLYDPGFPPVTSPTIVAFSVDDTNNSWFGIEQAVERMKGVAANKTAKECDHPTDMRSKTSPCNAFGGCGYKYACPHSPVRQNANGYAPEAFDFQDTRPMSDMNELSKLLAARRAAAAGPVVAPPTPPVAPVVNTAPVVSAEVPTPGGILPPDVPVTAPAAAPKVVQALLSTGVVEFNSAVAAKPAEVVGAPVVTGNRDCATQGHLYDKAGPACVCGKKKPGRKPSQMSIEEAAGNAPAAVVEQAAQTAPVAAQVRVTAEILAHDASNIDGSTETAHIGKSLLVNVNSSESDYTDLSLYVANLARKIAKAMLGDEKRDIRTAPKGSGLDYGAWKGVLTEAINATPPPGHRWRIRVAPGDEFAEILVSTMRATAGVEVIG